jgi:hypothetical protein
MINVYFFFQVTSYFGLDPAKPELAKHLGPDGLPFPGSIVNNRDPYYW